MTRLICCLFLMFGPAASAGAQTAVYPDDLNIGLLYELSDTVFSVADTLVVTRTLTNNEPFEFWGLYFSENLPAGLNVVDYTATLNGNSLTIAFAGPLPNNVLSGFRTYRWVVDSPESSENLSRTISPGDQVRLQYRIVATDVGSFSLPLHTTACYGDSDGIFAAGHTSIGVTAGSDDDEDPVVLPATWLVTSAYPNPFNAEVAIAYEGANLDSRPVDLEVYNLLGQTLARYRVLAEGDAGVIQWSPAAATGTGIFFYRLSCVGKTSTGKLMLLK